MLRKTAGLSLALTFFFTLSSVLSAANLLVPSEYSTIQMAINAAGPGDTVIVMPGVYLEDISFNGDNIVLTSANPDDPACVAATIIHGTGTGPVVTFSGNVDANCALIGLTITGGNASGDGGGIYCVSSSPTITNCTITGNTADYGGGMYNDWDSSPTLTNCTFSGNSAEDGGGMYNEESNPRLTNCTFSGNLADYEGGGMYSYWNSKPVLTNCTFSGNSAGDGGGMYNDDSNLMLTNCTFSGNSAEDGGAMYNDQSSLTLTGCVFTGNLAGDDGGGMCNNRCTLSLTKCTFNGNSGQWDGGGMCNDHSSPKLTNCIFSGNSAGVKGGGMCSDWDSSPVLMNCTLTGNRAGSKGGGLCNNMGSPLLTNCILWANTASKGSQIALSYNCTLSVNYCNVQDGKTIVHIQDGTLEWGGGNIDVGPCFVTPGHWDDDGTLDNPDDDFWVDGDYHLKSEGWRWDSDANGWTWDDVTSRCIDAGNPGTPLGEELLSVPGDPDNQRGENLRINMGVFGGTAEASMPPYDWAILGDLTNDGTVNFADFTHQAENRPGNSNEPPGDLDRNTIVDMVDFALIAQDWLAKASWCRP